MLGGITLNCLFTTCILDIDEKTAVSSNKPVRQSDRSDKFEASDKLKAQPQFSKEELNKILEELDSNSWKVRTEGSRKLSKIFLNSSLKEIKSLKEELNKRINTNILSLEVRRRIEDILSRENYYAGQALAREYKDERFIQLFEGKELSNTKSEYFFQEQFKKHGKKLDDDIKELILTGVLTSEQHYELFELLITAPSKLKLSDEIIKCAFEAYTKETKDPDKIINRLLGLAKRTNSEVVLKKLAEHGNNSVRGNAATNKDIPVSFLEQLATDKDPYVKSRVAANPKTPEQVLRDIYKDNKDDKDKTVVLGLALNPNIPKDLLQELYNHKSERVQTMLAHNPAISKEKLNEFVEHKDSSIREHACLNPNLTLEQFKKLFEDKAFDKRMLTQNKNTPLEILEKLSKNPDQSVRCILARHPKLSKEIIIALSKDPDLDVRISLLNNSNTPEDIIKILTKVLYKD